MIAGGLGFFMGAGGGGGGGGRKRRLFVRQRSSTAISSLLNLGVSRGGVLDTGYE